MKSTSSAFSSPKREPRESVAEVDDEDQRDMLMILIEGRRLRDISDLPFDLAT